MDEVLFFNYETYYYNFDTLFKFNQAFVDTIRNSGGNNIKRLLIVAGADDELDKTCSSDYKIPVDPSNKLAVSIHYYNPERYTRGFYFDPYSWIDNSGVKYSYVPPLSWGNSEENFQIITDFEIMNNTFLSKGIPIIISKVGVLTEQKKTIESIREYLYFLFYFICHVYGTLQTKNLEI